MKLKIIRDHFNRKHRSWTALENLPEAFAMVLILPRIFWWKQWNSTRTIFVSLISGESIFNSPWKAFEKWTQTVTRCEWSIKGIPIMLLPHSQRATLGFEIIFCSVCISSENPILLGLGFEMRNAPQNWQSKRVPRHIWVAKGHSGAIWVSAAIWYWYRISDDKELTHCALYHEQNRPRPGKKWNTCS